MHEFPLDTARRIIPDHGLQFSCQVKEFRVGWKVMSFHVSLDLRATNEFVWSSNEIQLKEIYVYNIMGHCT
jgi:hypothetical protein